MKGSEKPQYETDDIEEIIEVDATKHRHGFVTFWLWLALIVNIIACIIFLIAMFTENVYDYYGTNSDITILSYGFLSILELLNVLAIILLLRWKSAGFFLMIVGAVCSILISVTLLGGGIKDIFGIIVSIVIWWAILHIKKNGVSAWALMESGWGYRHYPLLYYGFGAMAIIILILSIVAIV
ncbi:MAG: hypothetical protein LUC88_00085 [Prevotella sp.]|nr:hypothetical protein [Prevotella sp.]